MMASSAEEDRRLVARAQEGDFAAFEALVQKYERRVFRLAMRILRRESLRAAVPLAEDRCPETYQDIPHPEYIAPWQETPEQIASRRETRQLLMEALDELDEKHRLVFLLRDVEGLSTAETAESLGISQANVKVRLLRARLKLRERLTRLFGDETTRVVPDHTHQTPP